MVIITEKDVEIRLKMRVEHLGGLVIKLPSSMYTGIPDRLVLLPNGEIAFIELKRPKGGKPSALQLYWIKKLQGMKFRACIVKNYMQLEAVLEDMTGGQNGRDETA